MRYFNFNFRGTIAVFISLLCLSPSMSFAQLKEDTQGSKSSILDAMDPILFQASDNAAESNFGINLVGAEFVWFTEFETEASSFPLRINSLDMYTFNTDCDNEIVDLYLYSDPDSNPQTGAVPVCEAKNVETRFGFYSVAEATEINSNTICCVQSTSSLIVAAVNRTCKDNTQPAALDRTSSEGTSWYRINPNLSEADPPSLVPTGAMQRIDDVGLAGNWMFRAQGTSNDVACNLPVELSMFNVDQVGNNVELNWTTQSELNNSGFEVEMSAGDGFRKLGFVEGYGNSDVERSYSFTTHALDPGSYTFRLRQVDFDGAFEFSPMETAFVTLPSGYVVKAAYPNPFNPSTTIQVGLRNAQELRVDLYNSLGHLVKSIFNDRVKAQEMLSIEIDAGGLATGQYILSIQGESWVDHQVLTLLK